MSRPRVLHLVHRLHMGGAETWLIRVLREWNPEDGDWTFGVWSEEPGAYEEEALAHGARVVRLNGRSRLALLWSLSRELKQGRYDVVHSHVHRFSGLTLAVAKSQGVPVRIAHAHTDSRTLGEPSRMRMRYIWFMRLLLTNCATSVIGCTVAALEDLLGKDHTASELETLVVPCGIEFPDATTSSPDLTEIAPAKEGIGPVIGHVGRFTPVKNHTFLIDVFAEFRRHFGHGQLELVGEGETMSEIQDKVRALGLDEYVTFHGRQFGVRRMMRERFDILLLPSFVEGFPVVLIESQAEGLPVVVSDVVAPEVEIVPGLVHRASLKWSALQWAHTISHALQDTNSEHVLSPERIAGHLAASGCLVSQNRDALAGIYRNVS